MLSHQTLNRDKFTAPLRSQGSSMNHSGNDFAPTQPLESQIEERSKLQQGDDTYPRTDTLVRDVSMTPRPVLLRTEGDTWAARKAQSRGRATGAAFGSFGNSNLTSAAVTNSAAVLHTPEFPGKGRCAFPAWSVT